MNSQGGKEVLAFPAVSAGMALDVEMSNKEFSKATI